MVSLNGHIPLRRSEDIIDLAWFLGNFTDSITHAQEVPELLSRAFGIEVITLAVIAAFANSPHDPQFIFLKSTGHTTSPGNNTIPQQEVLGLCGQLAAAFRTVRTDGSFAGQLGSLRNDHQHFVEIDIRGESMSSPGIAFAQSIDADHCVILIVHRNISDAGQSIHQNQIYCDVTRILFMQLRSLFTCLYSPNALGTPFSSLTVRELTVLHSLNSDLSEKQIANQLGLSQHTFHSHVKAIYRKMGVQGRLPLLRLLDSALRQSRLNNYGLNRHTFSECMKELLSYRGQMAEAATTPKYPTHSQELIDVSASEDKQRTEVVHHVEDFNVDNVSDGPRKIVNA